jgi:hypothetical protein
MATADTILNQKASRASAREKKIALPTVQRMAFISVEDLKIERVASGSNAD